MAVLSFLSSIIWLIGSPVYAGLYCSSTLTLDSLIPSNPGIIGLPDESTIPSPVHIVNSEMVTIPTMGEYDSNSFVWERSNCPHQQSGLTKFEDKFAEKLTGDITILSTDKIIITECSFVSTPSFNRIVIEAGGQLIFDDSNIELKTAEIVVKGSNDGTSKGQLLIGSKTCRLYSKINIIFTGDATTSSLGATYDDDSTQNPSKGLIVNNGIVDIHGKLYMPTWTRLARTVDAGTDIVYLQDCVNWEVGQEIVLTTTVYYDCPNDDYLREFCPPCYPSKVQQAKDDPTKHQECLIWRPHQNEIFTIIGIDGCKTIKLDHNSKYTHWSSNEYQGEIALITRRINLSGEKIGDSINKKFGGHTIVKNKFGEGRFSGIRNDFMGQLNILGRYPFHFHFLGNGINAQNSYFKDTVVTNSNWRCYTIHSTNSSLLTQNIAYNAYGHCFYNEDAVEELNEFSYNLAAHIHPIYDAAAGGGGQTGQQFVELTDLKLPADTAASGFYIPNAYNNYTGNAASGGWAGFSFVTSPRPLDDHQTEDYGFNNPQHRPNLAFDGNTAHSSGFYWAENGAAIYTGGMIEFIDGIQHYDSGRHDRETYKTDTQIEEWMLFTNTKAALCGKGISHWGSRVIIDKYQVSDFLQGAQLFGEAAIRNVIMTSRTDNENGWRQQWMNKLARNGFEYYGTAAKNILTQIEFRNFKSIQSPQVSSTSGISDACIGTLDFSDKWSPQGINAIKGIKFTNCDYSTHLVFQHCGNLCNQYHTPKAHNFYNIYDYDGSFIGTNKKTLIGSSNNWWNWGNDCQFNNQLKVWHCDWLPSRQIGYIDPWIEGYNDECYNDLATEFNPSWCDYPITGIYDPVAQTRGDDGYDDCSCQTQKAFYHTGYIQHFGEPNGSEDKKVYLSAWPGITGITNTGWYWSPRLGAPDQFTIGEYFGIQLERDHFIVLAIKYPTSTQFTVKLRRQNNNAMGTETLTMSSYENVMAKQEIISDQMECNTDPYTTGNKWYRMCDLDSNVNNGGIGGPSWYFDTTTGYFYLRIVNLVCYTRTGVFKSPEKCVYGYFEYDNVKIWDKPGDFNYLIEAQCVGCNVSRTYTGSATGQTRTFYQVNDNGAPPDFNPIWKTETMQPTPTPINVAQQIPIDSYQYHHLSFINIINDIIIGIISAIFIIIFVTLCLCFAGYYKLKPQPIEKQSNINNHDENQKLHDYY